MVRKLQAIYMDELEKAQTEKAASKRVKSKSDYIRSAILKENSEVLRNESDD